MNQELMGVLLSQAGVFTTRQAAEYGWDWSDLRAAVRSEQLVQVRRNVYTLPSLFETADPVQRHRIQAAAALVARGWVGGVATWEFVVGHRSAALLWGLPVPPTTKITDHVSSPTFSVPDALPVVELVSQDRSNRTARAGVRVRPAGLPPEHVTLLDGLPITTLARTTVDLLRELDRYWAVTVIDVALRMGCERDELRVVAKACALWRGGRQAQELVEFGDPRAESPLESIARLVVYDQGLPTPVAQLPIRDSSGRNRRLDLAFPERWTDLECDGKIKYTQPYGDPTRTLWDEKEREDSIRDTGVEVVRTNWREVVHEPTRLAARLRAAFARAEARRGA